MSFVSAVKDYVEYINHLYIINSLSENNLESFGPFWFIQQTLLYWLNSIKIFLSYIISFQWIRDIIYLPINLPKLTFDILNSHFVLNGDINTVNFWQNTSYNDNHILLGFLNSFFLYLPISAPILIAIRTLVVKGIPAGIFAGWGILTGQMLFLICVIFGLRDIVIPWFALEPWTYILGLILIVNAIYNMATSPWSLVPIKSENRLELFKIFAFHFVLNWTEQTCVFHYFGNFSFSTNPTILEHVVSISQAANESGVVLSHFSYLFGILVGSIFWLVFFGWLYLRLIVNLPQWLKTTYSFILDKFNLTILALTFGFAVSSIPYYGIDYLITKPIGFVSEDKALQAVHLRSELPDYNCNQVLLGATVTSTGEQTLETDISIFGRGDYLADEFSLTKEGLNYRGEFFWETKYDRINSILRQKAGTLKVEIPNLILPLNFVNQIPDYSIFWSNERMQQESVPDFEYLSTITKNSFNVQFHNTASQQKQEQKDSVQPKIYNNFVYKRLFNWDMDLFLNRKSKAQILTTNHEKNLFSKRQILSNYYNTLRDYKQIGYYDIFKDYYFETKSYADRVYNQQFQGTLKIIRRLFAITLSDVENPRQDKVLKYDQPLYNEFNYKKTPILHEELDAPTGHQTKVSESKQFDFHESQLSLSAASKFKPFIKLENPFPLYAGWDDNLRRFVITNRLLPRTSTGQIQELSKTEIEKYFNPNIAGSLISNNIISPSWLWSEKPSSRVQGTTKGATAAEPKAAPIPEGSKEGIAAIAEEYKNEIKTKQISFSAWPVDPEPQLEETYGKKENFNLQIAKNKKIDSDSSVFAFVSLNDAKYKDLKKSLIADATRENDIDMDDEEQIATIDNEFDGVPPNVVKVLNEIQPTALVKLIPPNRGGWLWPGVQNLKYDVKQNLSPLFSKNSAP